MCVTRPTSRASRTREASCHFSWAHTTQLRKKDLHRLKHLMD